MFPEIKEAISSEIFRMCGSICIKSGVGSIVGGNVGGRVGVGVTIGGVVGGTVGSGEGVRKYLENLWRHL